MNIITSLCHHPLVKERFTEGIVFFELGPQATDSSIISFIYYLYRLLGNNCTNGCHLTVFTVDVNFVCHSWLSAHPHPIRVLAVLVTHNIKDV